MLLKSANTPRLTIAVLGFDNTLPPIRPQLFYYYMKDSSVNPDQRSKRPLAQKPWAVKLCHWRSLHAKIFRLTTQPEMIVPGGKRYSFE
jgi:hypothetical protein